MAFDDKIIYICSSGLRGRGRVIKARDKYIPFFQERLVPETIGNNKIKDISLKREGSIVWFVDGKKIEIYNLKLNRMIYK